MTQIKTVSATVSSLALAAQEISSEQILLLQISSNQLSLITDSSLIMSNRYKKQDFNNNTSNKKYVPRNKQNFFPENLNATTLSKSLRQNSDVAISSRATSSGGRASSRDAGASAHTHSGNFVNYLPQDEAVAAGLSADEGGLDPVESQRVVDLLNRELSRLLKLKPRDFWREGI